MPPCDDCDVIVIDTRQPIAGTATTPPPSSSTPDATATGTAMTSSSLSSSSLPPTLCTPQCRLVLSRHTLELASPLPSYSASALTAPLLSPPSCSAHYLPPLASATPSPESPMCVSHNSSFATVGPSRSGNCFRRRSCVSASLLPATTTKRLRRLRTRRKAGDGLNEYFKGMSLIQSLSTDSYRIQAPGPVVWCDFVLA